MLAPWMDKLATPARQGERAGLRPVDANLAAGVTSNEVPLQGPTIHMPAPERRAGTTSLDGEEAVLDEAEAVDEKETEDTQGNKTRKENKTKEIQRMMGDPRSEEETFPPGRVRGNAPGER